IMDVDHNTGQFDYIICHGVYSWVPAEVRDKILAICSQNLAPNGIAYVSYNTYPGWHIRGMIREMMAYHVRQFSDPKERVQQARAFVEFLTQAVGDPQTIYGGLLQIEADSLRKSSDTYIFHEHLEEVNRPVYFHEFAQSAAAHGLQYLAEAKPHLLSQSLSVEAAKTLERIAGDLIAGEQYLDFVRNQTFRRTLLCHREVSLKRPPDPAQVQRLHATGLAQPSNRQ